MKTLSLLVLKAQGQIHMANTDLPLAVYVKSDELLTSGGTGTYSDRRIWDSVNRDGAVNLNETTEQSKSKDNLNLVAYQTMLKEVVSDKLNSLEKACNLLLSFPKMQDFVKYNGTHKIIICKEYHREASLKRTQVQFHSPGRSVELLVLE